MTPQQATNGVTLAGDAAHPMTPNLAQGGCTSLEDSVILTRKLCEALRTGKEEEGLSVVAPSLICFLRDNVALPVAFRASVVFGSSKFDRGDLPPPLD